VSAGYSAYFNDLAPACQEKEKEIIDCPPLSLVLHYGA